MKLRIVLLGFLSCLSAQAAQQTLVGTDTLPQATVKLNANFDELYTASALHALQSTTITIAGTANEVTLSAGAQSLAANRTWTVSLPSALTFTGKTITGGTYVSPDITTSITTGSSTLAVFNTTATTVNAFGATTALNVGASAALVLNFGGHTSAAEQRFLEPSGSGTNYIGFKAGAMAASTTYVLPTVAATAGQILSADSTPTNLKWIDPGAASVDEAANYTWTGAHVFNGSITIGAISGAIVMEGATDDANELSIAATDPTADRTATFPDADTKIPIASQFLTFTGPTAARTITLPDAAFTVARTDAANTFTGHQTIEGVTSTGATGTGKFVFDTAPQISTIELGAASDTTIARSGAGAITVEGVGVALNSTSLTHTASTIELGAASDTTLARVGAGQISVEGVNVVTTSSTDTLTNKTYDTGGTGNVFKAKGYIYLTHPHLADGTGATIGTTATAIGYGHATFSNSADKAGNYVEYYLQVPEDLDTGVDLRVRIKQLLGNTDTGKQAYELTSVSVADSAVPTSATLANAVAVNFAGDASGANGDVETSAWTTATGWRSALTAGQTWRIRLARDGDDGTNDTSTVNSTELGLVIEYAISQ